MSILAVDPWQSSTMSESGLHVCEGVRMDLRRGSLGYGRDSVVSVVSVVSKAIPRVSHLPVDDDDGMEGDLHDDITSLPG